jgi:hypothetical protein
MGEMLRLAENPLFVKHLRARMRRSAVISSVVVVLFLCICIMVIEYFQKEAMKFAARGGPPVDYNVGMWMMAAMQALLLNLMGGSQVAQSISGVKESGILDYHRITPLPSRVQALGFLLGAPIREYLLYITTLPFALGLCLWSNNVGVGGFAKIVLVQVGFALFSHSIALLVGLSSKQGKGARGASGRYIGIMVGIGIMSNTISGIGILEKDRYVGPSLLSPLPVVIDVLSPQLNRQRVVQRPQQPQQQLPQPQMKGQMPKGGFQQPPQQFPQQVVFEPVPEAKFMGIEFPLVVQTLIVQGMLICFIFMGCSRKVRSNRIPTFSKPQAVLFFAALLFLILGTIWGIRQEVVLIGNVYVVTALGCMLLSLSTQGWGDIGRGYQRAVAQGRSGPPPWSDLASNHLIVVSFALIMGLFSVLAYQAIDRNGPAVFMGNLPVESFIPMFGISIGTVIAVGFLIQFCHLKYQRPAVHVGFFLFFLWLATLIVGIIMSAYQMKEAFYAFAITPITSISMVSILEVNQNKGMLNINVEDVRMVAYFSTGLQVVLFLWLSTMRERRLKAGVQAEQFEDSQRILNAERPADETD